MMDCTEASGGMQAVAVRRHGAAGRGAEGNPRRPRFWLAPLVRILVWIGHRHRIRRDEAMLLRQSDYMLRDIGIGRGEIELAVRGKAWRKN